MPISVLIADDHAILRAGLRLIIDGEEDMRVAAEAADAPEAIRMARELQPDVITLDLDMPGCVAPGTIAEIRRDCPNTRVLVVTVHDTPEYLRAVLMGGGAGYVVKTAGETDLLSAIRAVYRGRTFVDLSLTQSAVQTVLGTSPNGEATNGQRLSQREREVLELAAQGYTNQKIAERLFLSVKTIETYRARLMNKLELTTRADLVRFAVENGLLDRNRFSPPLT